MVAEHEPFAFAGDKRQQLLDEVLAALALQQIEAAERRNCDGHPDRDRPDQRASLPPFAISATRPMMANASWVDACTSTSTMTLAAATVPLVPRSARQRAPMKSPPICASGSSAFAASRMLRTRTHSRSDGRRFAGEQQPPADAGPGHTDGAHQHDQDDRPAGAGHRLANGAGAGPTISPMTAASPTTQTMKVIRVAVAISPHRTAIVPHAPQNNRRGGRSEATAETTGSPKRYPE